MEDVLLVLAMITDTFFVSLAYAGEKIRIPAVSAVIICIVSTLILSFSLLLSDFAASFFPQEICRLAGALILGIIGTVQFCQNSLKAILRKHSGNGKISFSCFNIGFVVSVFLDETKADFDRSKVLSAKESVALSLALSLDSFCGGLAAGISGTNILTVSIMSFILGILAVAAGGQLGKRISNTNTNLSWLSGIFLIFLAVCKLL